MTLLDLFQGIIPIRNSQYSLSREASYAIKKSRFSNGSIDSICSLILENWYYWHNFHDLFAKVDVETIF
ncbi:hypothetical protein NIES4101_87960 [Calothrix sp. NIES-4101]|nr:hypothetical protein NIES4101_87960 [Calothrix sp. NIES-4101]